MTTLLNRNNHPVEIKKIKIQIWTLRSEIETIIAKRMEESPDGNIDIKDIQNFYNQYLTQEEILTSDSELSPVEESENETKDEEPEEEKLQELTDKAMEKKPEQNEGEDTEDKDETNLVSIDRPMPGQDKIFTGEVFLSDIHMISSLVFSNSTFTHGQNIVIKFMIPEHFSITAEVKEIHHFARTSKIIKENKIDYRIKIKHLLSFPQERENLRSFLKSVEPEIPPQPKKRKKAESGSIDEFEDLGF